MFRVIENGESKRALKIIHFGKNYFKGDSNTLLQENQIEQTLIDTLTHRKNRWTYRPDLKTETALWDNVRHHINRINLKELDGEPLTDKEFTQIKNEFKRSTATPFLASQWLRGENGLARVSIEREDASKGFEKRKNQNSLRDIDIEKIITAYKRREELPKYAHLATYEEITRNDHNLNIARYVDTFEEEEPIDITALSDEIVVLNTRIRQKETGFVEMLDQLAVTGDTKDLIEATKRIFGTV